jgi:hypothetical protein
MPQRKKKQWPTPPLDPELRVQVMTTIEAYTSGRYEMVFNLPMDDQRMSKEVGVSLMKTLADFVRAYENNEFSPTMQKKIIATLKKTVRRFAPR